MTTGDALALAVALGVGLLLGVERERRKGEGPSRRAAGVRTFTLAAVLGAVARLAGGDALVAVGAAIVGALAVAAHLVDESDDPGITTEVALLVAYALGVLAVVDAQLAAAAGVVCASLLAARGRLHRLVRESLTEAELHDGLIFLAAAVVALPLVPDRSLGPNGVFNPFAIWRLVVVLMGIGGLGYVAVRIFGPRVGLPLTGLLSGFVSAVAAVAAMGGIARHRPASARAAAAGAAFASVATVLLAAALVGSTSIATLRLLAPALVVAGATAVVWASALAVRALGEPGAGMPPGRAFDLRWAVFLAAVMTVVLAISTLAGRAFSTRGVVVAAALAGFADAHAPSTAAAVLAAEGRISPEDASLAVLAALTTNSVTKVAFALASRNRLFVAGVSVGLVAMIGGAWATYLLA